MSKRKDVVGCVFGRLTVIAQVRLGDGRSRLSCRCECGEMRIINKYDVVSGRTRSCGCLRKEETSKKFLKHGESSSRLYNVYTNMKDRCNNPNNSAFDDYGARGIKVCSEWNNYENFRDWAVKNGYNANLTLDRINNDGNYEPSNCRWATLLQQARNTRKTVLYTISNERKSLAEWCDIFNIPLNRAHKRIYAGNKPFTLDEIYTAMKGKES